MADSDGEYTLNDKLIWIEGLTENGNYWEGIVADVDLVLWCHNLKMVTSYGTRTSRKIIQNQEVNKDAHKENNMVSNVMYIYVFVLEQIHTGNCKNHNNQQFLDCF